VSARPLHLLEVGINWPPETFLCWKLEGLAAKGLRVTVASRAISDPDAGLEGVELHPLPQGRQRPSRVAVMRQALRLLVTAPRRLLALLREIRRTDPGFRRRYRGTFGMLALYLPLARLRPDVVHFEWNGSAALYLPLFDVWRCPVIASCHGSEISVDPHVPGEDHVISLLPQIFGSASAVHCVSESLRSDLAELGVEAAKTRLIRQGVDPNRFRPANGARGPAADRLRLVAIAWPRWVKGLEWALVAVRSLVDARVPVRLELIGAELGDQSERERLRHTVLDLGLEDHVGLLGNLSSDEVADRLRASDALLVPSLDEGLPTVILEAMACGVPVVATDCGGVSEALTDGVEGFVVPPRDSEALKRALERLWREPELRTRMGEAGRRTATSRFTLERQLDEFLAMYREVARS